MLIRKTSNFYFCKKICFISFKFTEKKIIMLLTEKSTDANSQNITCLAQGYKQRLNYRRLIFLFFYYVCVHFPYVIFQTYYYLRQYFTIQIIIKKKLKEKLINRPIYRDYSKSKLVIATTYTTLCGKIIIDIINGSKFPLTRTQELSALIDLYFLIILADDEIDQPTNKELDKIEMIECYFKGFEILADNPNNISETPFNNKIKEELKVFIEDHKNLYKDEYKDDLKRVLKTIKRAYIEESKRNSLVTAWKSLYRISRVAIDLYELMASCIVNKKLENNSIRTILYNLAFCGNMIDDWMDFYWTKEDQDQLCYINFLGDKYSINRKNNILFYIFSFCVSLCSISKRQIKVRIKARLPINALWIFPTFMLIGFLVGPISIILHLKEKKL